MIKACSNCRSDYFAKWRNEPVSLCPACRANAVLCAKCKTPAQPPPDRAQLWLFSADVVIGLRDTSPRLEPEVDENVRYWSYRYKAAEPKRKRFYR